jgi:PAS domain S-box-containing protein
MNPKLILLLQRLDGWRLRTLLTGATVLAALAIVSVMGLLLKGEVTADYLLTGFVAAVIVAPPSLALLSYLLRELARQQHEGLASSIDRAEGRLKSALESTDEGVLMLGEDGKVLSVNRRLLEIWRVPPHLAAVAQVETLLAHGLDQLASREPFLTLLRRLGVSEEESSSTLHFRDGQVFACSSRALSRGSERGRIWCFRDVSAQVRTQAALAEREDIYRTIVTQANEAITLIDTETFGFVEFNDAACTGLGYTREEFRRLKVPDILGDMDAENLPRLLPPVIGQCISNLETLHRHKDGSLRNVLVSLRGIDLHGHTYMVANWSDITERKRVEQSLNLAIEVTGMVLWEFDVASGRLRFDRTMLPLLGLDAETIPQTVDGWIERVHADDRQFFAAFADIAKLPGDAPFDLEFRIADAAGRHHWLHTRGSIVQRDAAGQATRVVGSSMNISARKEAEEALRGSEEHARKLAVMLRLMCDNVPDMIWAKDLEHRYLFANKAYCQQVLKATDTTEPVGKTDLFFARRELESHLEDPLWHGFGELCQETDAITLERGKPSVFEEIGNIQGKPLCLAVHKAPFLDQQGEVIGTVGSARDITEHKQIAAELAQHRLHLEELVQQRSAELMATEAKASLILQASADGLYGVDVDGRISFINPAGCRMLGFTEAQVIGRSAHPLFHHSRDDGSPYPVAECPIHSTLRSGAEIRVDDATYWHADGHAVPVMLAVKPTALAGESVCAVVSFVDMSAQRAAAQAREQALLAAENLARARSEFLANMSHEIRTPMNGVLGFAQIGLRNSPHNEKARKAFEMIIASGNQLLGVVNEILDFSKIEAGKLHIEANEMSLVEALDQALALVADRARAKGLGLRLERAADFPPSCIGDSLRFGQVLLNLLSNAIKFTEAGGVVLTAARRDAELVFRVEDTGIGMSEEQLGYIFNPFQQADGSTTRRFGGTGLGLAICKRILELMQGEIRVESRPGVGSRFEFRLPYVEPIANASNVVAAPPLAPAVTATMPARPLAGLSILVAEDDPVNQMILDVNLSEDGARVAIVGDGGTAVERIVHDGPGAYDIVLMDIQMPGMDGYEAARRILALAPALPIVGQTAHAFGEDRDKCFAAGMVGHIAKPIDPAVLVQLVLRVVAGEREP